MQRALDVANVVANKISGDHTKRSMVLQVLLVILIVLRVLYALWAVIHLSFTSLMWSLVVLGVLFLGLFAARNRPRLLLLFYVGAMCLVMVFTTLGLFLVLLGDVLTLSVDLVEIIVDGSSLLLELVTVAFAYSLYLHLDPHREVTLGELSTDAGQTYMQEHSINIDLQDDEFMHKDNEHTMEQNINSFSTQFSPVGMNNAVYSPYVVYPVVADPNLSLAATMPRDEANPFQEAQPK